PSSARRVDLPVSAGITLLVVMLGLTGGLGVADGAVLLAVFAVFLGWVVTRPGEEEAGGTEEAGGGWVGTILGLIGLPLAAQAVVVGASGLAAKLGVPDAVIGATVVAAGTSLPELAATVAAARGGHHALAVGNVVGSNIFNLLLILGVSAVLAPLDADQVRMFLPHVAVLVSATLAVALLGSTVQRWQGATMIAVFLLVTVGLTASL
ncbi:MAG: hypothetical protein KC656_12795, partial [Myxococcales bacterium]|nr:hypothetical protein [Myxococcales bacterium]